jgi:hypothetical protein
MPSHVLISFKPRVCGCGLFSVHYWRLVPSCPAHIHSWLIIIYLVWTVVRSPPRNKKSKFVCIHVRWPICVVLNRQHEGKMNYKRSCTYHFITKPNNRKKTPKILAKNIRKLRLCYVNNNCTFFFKFGFLFNKNLINCFSTLHNMSEALKFIDWTKINQIV